MKIYHASNVRFTWLPEQSWVADWLENMGNGQKGYENEEQA